MKFYEIATLKTVIFGAGKAAPGIEAWLKAPEAKGRLLGAFASDIGALNEVYVLRGFDSLDDLAEERDRALRSDDPFGCLEHLVDLSFDSYRPLDFLPPVEPGKFVWTRNTPDGGKIEYVTVFDAGNWHETGRYSRDGATWRPIFEMKLKKKN